ncbi:uncharacterized protein LAESUDRAFT_73590 [Laetiporus sulphureus 93-53]|uniref:Uncharacterized protein n=1 Tax=Laetiporus sulphureus 93-53 TaxID=1314785 RepID=A0A165EZT0_9APHY|nr:uncharacterized protein LAESUDRAFT_73590 [Laetiporus sulphureus 93-53]KZT08066.1 hypothetical protein LAESUDRAFT_73590 [Laetiporus sulphureus 93-53]
MKTTFDHRGHCIFSRCISRSLVPMPTLATMKGTLKRCTKIRIIVSLALGSVVWSCTFLVVHRSSFHNPLLHMHHVLPHNMSANSGIQFPAYHHHHPDTQTSIFSISSPVLPNHMLRQQSPITGSLPFPFIHS